MICFLPIFVCMKLIGTTVHQTGHGTINRDCPIEIGTVGNYVGSTIVIEMMGIVHILGSEVGKLVASNRMR